MASKQTTIIRETDLYQPIHDYLVEQGYTVRSEVKNCDITAIKDDELIIIEMKRSCSTSLFVQAVQRQQITDAVYVALPKPEGGVGTAQWKGIKLVLRRLELGLILVTLKFKKPKVEVVFHPIPYDRKKKKAAKRVVLREINGRVGDFNEGGCTRTKIATAYRENVIHIACCLEKFGPLSPKQLRDLGTGPKTGSILQSDFYGWFDRIDKGIYTLKPQALLEFEHFPDLVKHYREIVLSFEF